MDKLIKQLEFDGKRLLLRNFGFVFMSLLMPTAFYMLFTKVMVIGNAAQMKVFNLNYMGSMIVYSMLMATLMGIATFLMRDREQGLLTFLRITSHNLTHYYTSLCIWSMLVSLLTVLVLGIVATIMNHVSLELMQWLALCGLVCIGQVPILLLGIAISFVKRQESLSVLCNLIVFPTAIISGLWWPIQFLPEWVQEIGKRLPTYYLNKLISELLNNDKINWDNMFGILAWIVGMAVVAGLMIRRSQKGSIRVSD